MSDPNLCEVCRENAATIHIHESVNGVQHVLHLCENCARAQNAVPFHLNGFLSAPASREKTADVEHSQSCPVCGRTLETFRKSELLGCPQCYTAFGEVIEQGLASIHRGTNHRGLRPSDAPEESSEIRMIRDEIESLERSISQWVSEENYEAAAAGRDRIAELKSKLKS